MNRIIAVANHKGGVGKTTSVASIGAALAYKGRKVLLVDLDAQANLTGSFFQKEQERTIYDSLKNGEPLPVENIRKNLDIVCSSLDMAGVELELSSRMSREFILKDLLEPIQERYEYILLDCPPSLGIITLNAMVASTELYIPLTAETLPTKGLHKIMDILHMAQKRLNPSISHEGIIITRWENSNLSRTIEEKLRGTFGYVVFKTKIRKNISLAEAPLFGTDILTYAPGSNGAKDYESLTEEILQREAHIVATKTTK